MASKKKTGRAIATNPVDPNKIFVTVRPLVKGAVGGSNIELGPHLEKIGEEVGVAFERMIKAVGTVLPDEFSVKIGFTLEGSTNWVVAGAKAGASLEVEGTWKKN